MASNTPQPGAVLSGKYRLLRELGRGGMGTVFEAEHALTGKRVALKWMHMQSSADPEAAQRFVREAQASARLRHPNVVDVYDVECLEHEAYMVMELLEGEPLTAVMDRREASLQTMVGYMLPAMHAVAKAHESGVIHRDIKPDNIFLARHEGVDEPVPKVLDFGISKVMGTETLSMTRMGAAMGTPQYMSLEQLYGQRDVDGRTDVYAFGVMLYEAATGRLPYDADSITELAVKIATTDPPHPRSVRPDLPDALCDVILRAMAKDRDERYPSMQALIDAVTPFATGQVDTLPGLLHDSSRVSAHSVTPISQPAAAQASLSLKPGEVASPGEPDPARTFSRRYRTRVLALGALLASLLLFGIALAVRFPWDTDPPGTPSDAPGADAGSPDLKIIEAAGKELPDGVDPADSRPVRARGTTDSEDDDAQGSDRPRGQVAVAARVGRAPRSIHEENDAPTPATAREATRPSMEPQASPESQDADSETDNNKADNKAEPSQQAKPKPAQVRAPVSILAGRNTALPRRSNALPSRTTSPPVQRRAPAPPPTPRVRVAPRAPGPTTRPPAVPFRDIVGLKAAYNNHRLSAADYKAHVRTLKLWRKEEIRRAKLDYRARVIDKRTYKLRIQAIDRIYAGR